MLFRSDAGEDPYDAFARTDVGVQGARGGGRRPEWNSQRPGRRFVPASERYPAGLQQSRQEKRLRRQIELMTLVERNTASRTPQPDPLLHPPLPRQASPTQGRTRAGPPRKVGGDNVAPRVQTDSLSRDLSNDYFEDHFSSRCFSYI